MPTSKDILNKAEKNLKENSIAKMAVQDSIKLGEQDAGAYAKARSVLATSINSMTDFLKVMESKIKELNSSLSTLKKNEAVMKAPADAKKYQALTKGYAAAIKESMQFHKAMTAALKKAQATRSGK